MSNTISSQNRLSHTTEEIPDLTSVHLSHFHQPIVDQNKSDIQLQVVHAITGRIRIRTTDGSWNPEIAHLSQELKHQNWILKIFENQNLGSLTFTFDAQTLPLHQVLQLLTEFDVKHLPATDKINLDEIKQPGFWQQQTSAIIPLIAGFMVTRGLRINGFPAIVIYMLTADTARWLMNSISLESLSAVISTTSAKFNPTAISIPGLTPVDKKQSSPIATSLTINDHINYQVIHQIPGRVRFHIPKLSQDPIYTQRLENLLKNDIKVSNFRVNINAASLLINYHHPEISISYWVELITIALSPEIHPPEISQTLEQEIAINDLDSNRDVNIDIDLSNLWTDFKPGIMSYSLSVLANFPL